MAILRIIKKEGNFLILDKTCMQEKGLSLQAKGLHAYLMCMTDNWQIRINNLRETTTNGRDAIYRCIEELKNFGYITMERIRNDKTGKFSGVEYIVHEQPIKIDEIDPVLTEKPPIDNATSSEIPFPNKPHTGKPLPENPTLISIKNNNNLYNKKAAADKKKTNSVNSQQKAAAATCQKEITSTLASKTTDLDLSIGTELTLHQIEKIRVLAEQMCGCLSETSSQKLASEIEFCILSRVHFKACKLDFFRKLNAIRVVIQRGEWLTPVEIIQKQQTHKNKDLELLESNLQNAYREIHHFTRSLKGLSGAAKSNVEEIIAAIQSKVGIFNEQLAYYRTQ